METIINLWSQMIPQLFQEETKSYRAPFLEQSYKVKAIIS